MEAAIGHREALAVVEVLHVQPETAVGFEIDEVLVNRLLVEWPAVRRQTHQLVFTTVYFEAAVIGEGGVKQTQRVGELQVMCQADLVAFANPVSGRAPFAHAVKSEDRGFFKRARKEGAGRM